jgi:transcriptional regulator with XRE-family HTH domain
MRMEAGLTARSLAALTGWHYSKVSKLEKARQSPSISDIRALCKACEAEDQVPDIVASLHAVDGQWVEWQRVERTGMRRLQESYWPLYEKTRQFRIYEFGMIPSILQTPAYATATMERVIEFSGVPNDLEEAVTARIERQRVLQVGDHRFLIVLEEAALRMRIGEPGIMAGQLGHLINVAALPRVSLGIVPPDISRTMWSSIPGFWIYDDERVLVETPSAELTITQPREIAVYARTFAELASMAVYGAEARALVVAAIETLDG